MSQPDFQSWGRYPRATQKILRLGSRHDLLPDTDTSLLAYGNGRSYGDSCLNPDATLLHTRNLDHFISFDPENGHLSCEAGVLLSEILDLIVPRGWFLPVTPGTQFITVGGAIANDVHGKNHHRAGAFGHHVRSFELLRSDGTRLVCSPYENPGYFAATIGGMGLTGVILWAELQLRRVESPFIRAETQRYRNLEEFFDLSAGSNAKNEYTVAWVDTSARGQSQGRGLFSRGDHVPVPPHRKPRIPRGSLTFPIAPPFSLVNALSLRVFNTLYYRKPFSEHSESLMHYRPFLYPLDGVLHWNRIYGPAGFFQHQSVVPLQDGRKIIGEMLEYIRSSGAGSFLTVLKIFGDQKSRGMLSFPRPGITLAVDFPNRGKKTLELLAGLDRIVDEAAGAIYPAKDARMTADQFRRYFPAWRQFADYVDPRFSSGFWRRVMEQA